MHSSIYLLIYLGIVNNVCIEQKGAECLWSLRGSTKQFTRKLQNGKKKKNLLVFVPFFSSFLYWVSKDKNVNVSLL